MQKDGRLLMGTEKNFENRIKKFLTKNNIWYIKFFANAFTKSGIPDILCSVNGRFVGIEVKKEQGIVSELQEFHLNRLNQNGAVGILAYPSGYDELQKILINIINDRNYDVKTLLNDKGYIKCKRSV